MAQVNMELVDFAAECLEDAVSRDQQAVLDKLEITEEFYKELRDQHGGQGAAGFLIGLTIGKGLVRSPEDALAQVFGELNADPVTGEPALVA